MVPEGLLAVVNPPETVKVLGAVNEQTAPIDKPETILQLDVPTVQIMSTCSVILIIEFAWITTAWLNSISIVFVSPATELSGLIALITRASWVNPVASSVPALLLIMYLFTEGSVTLRFQFEFA